MGYKKLLLLRKAFKENNNWKALASIGKSIRYVPGIDEYTKLLIAFDGSVDSGVITDRAGHTVTNSGVVLKETQAKFGQAGFFDSAFITVDDSDDWTFGTGDFTIDFWAYPIDITAKVNLICQYASAVQYWRFYWTPVNNRWVFTYVNNTTSILLQAVVAGVSFTRDAWTHIAIVRSSGTIKIYLNGISQTTTSNINHGYNIPNFNAPVILGRNGEYDGYMDMVRISNTARWTENFDVPTSAY